MANLAEYPVGTLWIFLRERNGLTEAFISILLFSSRSPPRLCQPGFDRTRRENQRVGREQNPITGFGHNHAARMYMKKWDTLPSTSTWIKA